MSEPLFAILLQVMAFLMSAFAQSFLDAITIGVPYACAGSGDQMQEFFDWVRTAATDPFFYCPDHYVRDSVDEIDIMGFV